MCPHFISNKGINYYNLDSSIALEIISNISLNNKDLKLDFNYTKKDLEKKEELIQKVNNLNIN